MQDREEKNDEDDVLGMSFFFLLPMKVQGTSNMLQVNRSTCSKAKRFHDLGKKTSEYF